MTHYENLGQFSKILDLLLRLKPYLPNDPNIDRMIETYKLQALQDTTEVSGNIIK